MCKKAGVSDKTDYKPKFGRRVNKVHFILLQGKI
jgi:hypothetical protein